MKPLVRASVMNPKFRRSAVFNIVVLAFFALVFALPLASGEPGFMIFGAAFVVLFVLGIVSWVRRIRVASGAAPVLFGEVTEAGITLRSRLNYGILGSSRVPKTIAIPRGASVWLSEERPDSGMEFLVGVQPHRYWMLGEGTRYAFASYSRLTRDDLKPLEETLSAAGVALHLVLERTPEQGPVVLEAVTPGAPRTVTFGLPEGTAAVGMYSQRGTASWVPPEQAYASGLSLHAGNSHPVTVTFAVDRLDSTGWTQAPGTRLPAYADTVSVATREGVAQVLVQVPQGFSIAYVFRQVGASGSQIYIHLDGPPATPV